MFRIERPETGFGVRVVDVERDAEIQSLRSGIREWNGEAKLLAWGHRRIAVVFGHESRIDGETGAKYLLYTLLSVGDTTRIVNPEIDTYRFDSEAERSEAQLLAIEGILVGGFAWVNGRWNVEATRFLHEGREWRVTDFGYAGWSPIPPGAVDNGYQPEGVPRPE